jgi:pyruvate formate-lyase activating enzyme-like uncharacterized protein
MSLKNEVVELHHNGYSLDEIAEELGITEQKAESLLGELVAENDKPLNSQSKIARQRQEEQQNRALNRLKKSFDDLVKQVQELNEGDEVSIADAQDLLETVRSLELEFRQVARQYHCEVDNSQHRTVLVSLISELKTKVKEWKEESEDEDEDDYEFSLELEEDLLEQLDDLRFELVSFEAE